MPAYRLKNLETGNELLQFSSTNTDKNLFADAVEEAKCLASRLDTQVAVMSYRFCDDSVFGSLFTSELYVAQPQE